MTTKSRSSVTAQRRIAFTLPLPVSANKLWTTKRGGGLRLTDAAKAYKQEVGLTLNLLHVKPFTSPVRVTFTAYMKSEKRYDLDNLNKCLLDSIKGIIFTDDILVWELHAIRRHDAANPRVEVVVSKLNQVNRKGKKAA